MTVYAKRGNCFLCSGYIEHLQGPTLPSKETLTGLHQLYLGQRIFWVQRHICGSLGEALDSKAASLSIITSYLLFNHITGNIHQCTIKKSFNKFKKNQLE